MKFVANTLNGVHLADVLPCKDDEVDNVLAAVAYGSNSTDEDNDFLGHCLRNRYRLDLWMRYDHTVPVAVPLLQRLLRHERDNVFCKFIPDCMHSKVIWWRGYGAYIGSANLTNRAWFTNIEAGLFLTEEELQRDGIDTALENFFDELRDLDVAIPLSADLIKEMEAIQARRKGVMDLGKDLRKAAEWGGPVFFDKKMAVDRRRDKFEREWKAALAHMQNIAGRLQENRPKWVPETTPLNWQVDQFLHAYYYNRVGEGREKPYEDYYRRHFKDPNSALNAALAWWKGTEHAPSHEDEMLKLNAPIIQRNLSRERLGSLTEQDLLEVCERTHATREHVIKMDLGLLGRPDLVSLPRDERMILYAAWLNRQRNALGWNIAQLLNFVLYGGPDDELWSRIYAAATDQKYTIPRYKLSMLAEVAGWARPEVAPPRNGRTSKALRALGFDVKVY
jgi:hypothetical protein